MFRTFISVLFLLYLAIPLLCSMPMLLSVCRVDAATTSHQSSTLYDDSDEQPLLQSFREHHQQHNNQQINQQCKEPNLNQFIARFAKRQTKPFHRFNPKQHVEQCWNFMQQRDRSSRASCEFNSEPSSSAAVQKIDQCFHHGFNTKQTRKPASKSQPASEEMNQSINLKEPMSAKPKPSSSLARSKSVASSKGQRLWFDHHHRRSAQYDTKFWIGFGVTTDKLTINASNSQFSFSFAAFVVIAAVALL
jgi:hypothetical protein